MKSHHLRTALASILLLCASAASAQGYPPDGTIKPSGFAMGQSLVVLNWEMSQPIGGFHDYISDYQLAGFSIEGRRKIKPNLSFGGSFSWNRFNQTFNNVTLTVPGGVVSGPVYRYADMFAIRALVHYYFSDGPIQPYLGVGIGGVWGYAFQQSADLSRTQNDFYFIVDPELGVLWNLVPGYNSLNVNVAVRFTYSTMDVGAKPETMHISPIIGLAWGFY